MILRGFIHVRLSFDEKFRTNIVSCYVLYTLRSVIQTCKYNKFLKKQEKINDKVVFTL